MQLSTLFKTFRDDEAGAVTVDWVVLTAAIVGLGIAVGSAVWDNTKTVNDKITASMGQAESDTAFDTGTTGGTGG